MLALGAGLSCGLVDNATGNNNCGAATQTLLREASPNAADNATIGITLTGKRFLNWDQTIENLCVAASESGNSSEFNILVVPSTPNFTISMQGRVYADAFAAPYSMNLTPISGVPTGEGASYKGTVSNIGLQQGSLDGKTANIVVELHLEMPSSGSEGHDRQIINEYIDRLTVTTKYHVTK